MSSVGSGPSPGQTVRRWLDALAYSSVLAAGVAAALAATASLAYAIPLEPSVITLAFSGTLVVYNIDRLRDLELDRLRAPLRSAFVDRHRRRLGLLALAAALVSGICALQIAPAAWGLCAGVLAIGLLHRRLKHIRGIKTLYLTVAWLAVVVGLPLLGPGATAAAMSLYWTTGIIGCAIVANLLASNLDRRGEDKFSSHTAGRPRLRSAIAIASLGVGAAFMGPDTLRGLVFVPLLELWALCRFREGERYGLIVIDGALLVGALGAILFRVLTPATV